MELTPYQQEKFNSLETIQDGKWYAINKDRPDREEFIEALKLYIEVWGTLEINSNYTAFRRTYPLGTLEWMMENEKTDFMPMVNELLDQAMPEHIKNRLKR